MIADAGKPHRQSVFLYAIEVPWPASMKQIVAVTRAIKISLARELPMNIIFIGAPFKADGAAQISRELPSCVVAIDELIIIASLLPASTPFEDALPAVPM